MHQTLTLSLLFLLPLLTEGQVIDEIQFNTSGIDDEWVEICNPDNSPLSLSSFTLSVDNAVVFTFPGGAILPAEECVTIGLGDDGDASDDFNAECPFIPTYLRAGLVLNSSTANTNILPNDTASISLKNSVGTLIDKVEYGENTGFGGKWPIDKSITLISLTFDNNSTSNFNWVASLDAGGSPNLPANANCPSARTELSFTTTASSADESDGTLQTTVCVKIARPSFIDPTTVEVALMGGSATNGTDVATINTPVQITFPAGSFSDQCLEINVNDDNETEGIENLIFTLQNPMGGRNMATLGANTSFDLSIIDNDITEAVINEILFNPLGSTGDNEREFFEIRGTPNASLAGIWLISIDGDGTSAGRINAEVDLGAYTLGDNGLLLIRDMGMPFTPAPAAESTVVEIEFGSSIFQNGTGTFLLVTNHNDNINDIDSNNDGTIDITSWNTILDAVSITDGGASDRVYAGLLSGTDLPRYQGSTTAHGVFRSETDEWLAATSQAGNSGSFEFDFATVWNSADEAIAVNTIMPPQFTPGNIGQPALAVEVINFFAQAEAEFIILTWQHDATISPAYFQINHSIDGHTFLPLQRISSDNNQRNYQFVDQTPQLGVNYYQLQIQNDFGDNITTQTLSISYQNSSTVRVYPTLIRDEVYIEGIVPNTTVTIFNQLGEMVLNNIYHTNTSFRLPERGIYFMKVNQQGFRLLKTN